MSDRREKLERLEALLGRALDGLLPEDEAREIGELLRDDPEAQRAYVRHCQLHAILGEKGEIQAGLEEGDKVVPLPLGARSAEASEKRSDTDRATVDALARRWAGMAAFGIACAAAGVAAALFVAESRGPSAESAPIRVASHEVASRAKKPVREARLSDGSTVQLAPQSTVSLNYTKESRALELEAGEAHFSVAVDKDRPFVVAAGPVRVRAVGTAFNVRRAGERVVVTVIEGKVDVYRLADSTASDSRGERRPDTAASRDAVTVASGGQVRWDEEQPGPALSAVDPAQVLSWREGRLAYTREPLRAVVSDLNRYSDRPVVIRDEAVGRLRVTGTVFTDATSAWLATLPNSLPVRVNVENDSYVILSSESREGAR
jgi:transmembrane sensor